jgi:ankyrin repeat protein
VKHLVEKYADVKVANNDGKTPLHWAAENGDLDVVKYLVVKGADAKVVNMYYWTPLYPAV